MKTILLILCMAVLAGCSKKEEENPAKYAGTYKGDVEVYIDGNYDHTITGHTLVIHPATWGDYAITNNLITRSTAPIINDVLSFNRMRVGSGSIDVYEYGTGAFHDRTLTLDLHQDEENPASGTVIRSHTYTGVLTRQ